MTSAVPHRVVVVGGGFGGMEAVKALDRAGVQVTLIDRHNYHLFQPLSYQVATGALSPGDIAIPLRHIFRRMHGVRVLMGEVASFDLEAREVQVASVVPHTPDFTVPYDILIVSGGSSYSYFGHEDWREHALEVKSLDSALTVRGRILEAFEAAELEPARQESWLTFVVVGAGPTGVEMAGQIAELARDTLPREYHMSDPRSGRVLLVEMGDRVLSGFPKSLSRRAQRSLEHLGVTSLLNHTVVGIDESGVDTEDAEKVTSRIATRTVVWAAGVTASPLARMLGEACGAEVDRAGRVTVEADLTLPGHPEVMALGDMVRVRDSRTGESKVLPGLSPVAMQEGRYAARVVIARRRREAPPRSFRYLDKGTLATIGRFRAVADIRGIHLSGFLAWFIWLTVHIYYLIGFENRLVVVTRWAISFFTRGRGSRLITEAVEDRPAPAGAESPRARVAAASDHG